MSVRACTALLLTAMLSGCGTEELVLADIIPASAFIDDMKRADIGMIGGVGVGGGTMTIVDINDTTFRVPIQCNGVSLGGLLLASGGDARLDVDLAGADVTSANELFGSYEGSRIEIVLTLGGGFFALENERHVGLSGWLIGGGISIWAGHQWLFVEATGAPVERPLVAPAP